VKAGRMFKTALFLMPIAALVLLCATAAPAADDNIPRITVQELKAKLDKGEDVAILDVRTGSDWGRSLYKIKGAIRVPITQVEERTRHLPKDKEVITYCT
jgi:hypothetical protein